MKVKDKEIRMLISEELGHSRINITSVYLGSWSKNNGYCIRNKIKIAVCGRCINCKLLIWNDKAELKPTKFN
jgi:hypothetical protein